MSSGGADCTLSNFRLYQDNAASPLKLVIASRDFGESYADTQTVHFDFYELKVDNDGIAGFPPLSFQFDHRADAAKTYCDVDDALRDELGMPVVKGARIPWGRE